VIALALKAGLRDWVRHPWQTALSALGIALGVAAAIAVELATGSAERAFLLSVERLTGPATHRVESATGQIPDSDFVALVPSLAGLAASPAIESSLRVGRGTPTLSLSLLGIDPLSFAGLRSGGAAIQAGALAALLTEPGAILLAESEAGRLGLAPGDPLTLDAGRGPVQGRLAGLIPQGGEPVAGLAVADLATAQELTGRLGRIDRIDLALNDREAERLAGLLPQGLRLVPAARRSEALAEMTRAFRANLRAMSLLALLVGGFLVYNAMTFAVLRRRGLLGTLRTLGVTRGQLFALVLWESLVLALAGSMAGLALGVLAGWGLVHLVVRTIDDLYFSLSVGGLQVAPATLIAGLALGVLATLAAALGPALEAARAEPGDVLRPGHLDRRGRRWALALAAGGLVLLGLGLALAQVESRSLGLGFLAILLAALGFALAVPALLLALARAIAAVAARSGSRPGSTAGPVSLAARLAARGLAGAIARPGVAVAALTVAIAATVGVGIMIESFRASLIGWLETTLQSDLYVSASGQDGGQLPVGLVERIAALPGVAELSRSRRVRVETGAGQVWLLALEPSSFSRRGFAIRGGAPTNLWSRFDRGELVLASEPFAYHRRLGPGDRVDLFTARGWVQVEIGAVFRDYGSDSGTLVMHRLAYAGLWEDQAISTLGLVLKDGSDQQAVAEEVRRLAESGPVPIAVSANRELRERSLAIFDRTFAITRVLRLLALAVAFVGVLSALLALELGLRREHAILRATGMTRGGLAGLILTQTSILGLAAGLFALPLGLLLGDLLIRVVNLRSFGWTMEPTVPAGTLMGALLLAWAAALLAGVYPAIAAARAAPAQSLRAE
jgi:putative ABC transport system permease protein